MYRTRSLVLALLVAMGFVGSEAHAQLTAYPTTLYTVTRLPTRISLDVDQVTYFSRSGSVAYVRVTTTKGKSYGISFPSYSSPLFFQPQPLDSVSAELMLDLVEKKQQRSADFRLQINDVFIWRFGSSSFYIADQGTDVKLTVKSPGTASWSLVSVRIHDDAWTSNYGTVEMVRGSGTKRFDLLREARNVFVEEEDDFCRTRTLQPMPPDATPRTGIFHFLDWLLTTPYGLRVYGYARPCGDSDLRIVHYGSWW